MQLTGAAALIHSETRGRQAREFRAGRAARELRKADSEVEFLVQIILRCSVKRPQFFLSDCLLEARHRRYPVARSFTYIVEIVVKNLTT
jgi:hypothetical protein